MYLFLPAQIVLKSVIHDLQSGMIHTKIFGVKSLIGLLPVSEADDRQVPHETHFRFGSFAGMHRYGRGNTASQLLVVDLLGFVFGEFVEPPICVKLVPRLLAVRVGVEGEALGNSYALFCADAEGVGARHRLYFVVENDASTVQVREAFRAAECC